MPRLSLAELDRAITAYLTGMYHVRVHGETHETPLDAWRGTGFLPRLPASLEDLDLLLVIHAKARVVRRDGMRCQELRYSHATLAASVGDAVTMRYDPRDLSEIRVFHHEQFLCRAVSEAHAGEVVTLQDIQTARRAPRRALRTAIHERVARVVDFLPGHPQGGLHAEAPQPARPRPQSKLRLYQEDDRCRTHAPARSSRRRSIGAAPSLLRRYANTATLACALAPLASGKPCPRAAMRIGTWQAR
jgi:putative transposase